MSENFHSRVAQKLAEFQQFVDAEFQHALSRSYGTTILNLDEVLVDEEFGANAPQELTEVSLDDRRLLPKMSPNSSQASANLVGIHSENGPAAESPTVVSDMPPADVQQNQPAEEHDSPTERPPKSTGGARVSERSEQSLNPKGRARKSSRHEMKVVMEDFMNKTMSKQSKILRKKSGDKSEGERNTALKRFVRSMRFDYISAFLVISNAAFIGVQVEFMFASETPVPVRIVDWAFCISFLIELTLRLYARGMRGFFFIHDAAWNRFDFFIVVTSTFDTVLSLVSGGENSPLGNVSLLRIARIIRITRVLRIIRVMKFFKDMRILVAAIASTLKTAFWAMLLLLISMYMFSIAICQIVAENVGTMADPVQRDDYLIYYFGSIGTTIATLFMTVAGGIDWYVASDPLSRLKPALVIYMFFIMFSSFCMLNVVTGIFCQSAIETFENDKDTVIECQLAEKERFVKTLTEMFTEWDATGDGQCRKEDFERHINDPNMQALLSTLDIESRDAMALYAMMDRDDSGRLDLDDFINGCITLRGGAKAIHMERALVDGKVTMNKLDRIIRKLEELAGNAKGKHTRGSLESSGSKFF